MFRRNQKPVDLVRFLDVPISMWISPTTIAAQAGPGKVLLLHGNFENIKDQDAYLLVQKHLDKIAA